MLFEFSKLPAAQFTWYWYGALRAHPPRRKEFPSRLYQRLLVGEQAWGNCRLMIGGSVADFARCFDALWNIRRFDEWSSDFDRLVSFGLMRIFELSSCSEFMMTPLSGDDFWSFLRGGLIEIRDDGGDESNSEKRRNIFDLFYSLSVVCSRRFMSFKTGGNVELWVENFD